MLYDPLDHRIRSFVTRAGRLSTGQARALEEFGPQYLIEYRKEAFDFHAPFGRKAPLVLEIGFGMGDTTAHIARAMPGTDFVGVEVHTPGVGSLLKQIGEQGIQNLRLIQPAFVKLLCEKLAPGGYIHCATDWEDYAVQMLDVLGAEPALQNTAEAYADKPAYRPLTKFENRGLKLGHGVWDLVFAKK